MQERVWEKKSSEPSRRRNRGRRGRHLWLGPTAGLIAAGSMAAQHPSHPWSARYAWRPSTAVNIPDWSKILDSWAPSTLRAELGRAVGRRTMIARTRSPTTWWAAEVLQGREHATASSPCAMARVARSRPATSIASATPSGRRSASRTDQCQPEHHRRRPPLTAMPVAASLTPPLLTLRRTRGAFAWLVALILLDYFDEFFLYYIFGFSRSSHDRSVDVLPLLKLIHPDYY